MDRLTIGNKEYRVECNFNALISYMDRKGEKDLAFLSETLSLQDMLLLMVCSINEGERLEGRPHDYTPIDFGTGGSLEMAEVIGKFMQIFQKQNTAADATTPKKA